MEKIKPQVGSIVLAFIATGQLSRDSKPLFRAFYGNVLTVSTLNVDELGTDGEPTLSIAFLAPRDERMLSRSDWHEQFERKMSVKHASHDAVQSGADSVYWTDVLPTAADILAISFDRESPKVYKDREVNPPLPHVGADEPQATLEQVLGSQGLQEEPSYLDHKDDGFAGEGDPYNIGAMTGMSAAV